MKTLTILLMLFSFEAFSFSGDCVRELNRLELSQKVLAKMRDLYESKDYKVDEIQNECRSGSLSEILYDEASDLDMMSQIQSRELDRDGKISADNFPSKYLDGKEDVAKEDICLMYEKSRSELNEEELSFFDANIKSDRIDQDHLIRLCHRGTLKANNFFR